MKHTNLWVLVTRFLGFVFVGTVAILMAVATPVDSRSQERPVVHAVKVAQGPRIDGFLNDDCWKLADPAESFLQREPQEGAAATEKTEVRIVYDRANLYFGIRCYDSEPEKIVATQLARDGDLDGDDHLSLVLDTYHDRRNAFYFSVNPLGARLDGYLTDESEWFDMNWNGVWDCRARIDSAGWTAEIVIPFRTLRYPKTAVQTWGVNFLRLIRRKNEEVLWSAWRRNHGLWRISEAGDLVGLRDLPGGARVQLLPYVTTGIQGQNGETSHLARTGGDVKLGLGPTLTLDLTAHTDFAQVEVDRARINLTRFSLYYPEKREFFLEGAGTFAFGSPYSSSLFYSRRIGLSEKREPIPVIGGARVTGRAGKYRIGLLSIATDRKGATPRTIFNVARIKRDVLKSSYVGFILTDREDEKGGWNHAGGADFTYQTSHFLGQRTLVASGYVAGTRSTEDPRGDWSGRFYVDYPNDRLDIFFTHMVIGERFNPGVGFVRRTGIRRTYAHFKWMPRPYRFGLRYLEFKAEADYLTDLSGRMLERSFEFRPFGGRTESGERWEFNIQPEYIYLDKDWNVFGDVVFKQGGYTFTHYEIQFETAEKRRWWGGLFYNWGPYYRGWRHVVETEWLFRFSRHLALSGDYTFHQVRASGSSFRTHEVSSRITLNVSPWLSNQLFVQWNNSDREVVANYRLHWIPKLGSHFYFVISQAWSTEKIPWRSKQTTLATKFVYLIWL